MKKLYRFRFKNAAAFLIAFFATASFSQDSQSFDYNSNVCNYSWINQISGTTQALRTVKAVNDMVAWSAGAGATVRKTINGGLTWTDGNPNPGVINGLIYNIDAVDANNAWCTTSPADTYIYKTTNGGINWTQVFTQPAGFINGIQFINSNTGFAQGDPVAARWSLWKTTNAGTTWDSAGLYLPQSGTDAGWVNSFQVTPDGNMWFGTNNTRVYRSTNFGATFSFAATTGLVNSYSVYFNNPSLGLAGGTTIVKSSDGGVTYTSAGTPPGTGNVNGIQGKDNDFWYIRGTGIYRSTNAGSNWTQAHTIAGTGNFIDFVELDGCQTGWAVSSTGAVAKMLGIQVGIGNNNEIVNSYRLEQNFPNPFNPVTTIAFELPFASDVNIKVIDILGRDAATIFSGYKTPGNYTIDFDATDLTSGIYFYKMTAGNFSEVKKMTLLK
ncbi:MAG: T9SS type A sorting domain-containing protein [Ignavibacteria bacterium]